MSLLHADPHTQAEPGRSGDGCRVRVVYRDSAGQIHLGWPADKVAEAVADAGGSVWVDVEDPPTAPTATAEALLRDVFHFHPLAVEDALKETHVPKVDDWGDYLYLVFELVQYDTP